MAFVSSGLAVIKLALMLGFLSADPELEMTHDGEKIIQSVLVASESFDIPPNQLLSFLYQESRFDPKAVGRNATSTDHGLSAQNSRYAQYHAKRYYMDTGIRLSREEIYSYNVVLGAYQLSTKVKRFGDMPKALMAYNGGDSRVVAGNPPKKSVEYSKSILAKSSGWLYDKEVLPLFICRLFKKQGGGTLTANEAYAKVQMASQFIM